MHETPDNPLTFHRILKMTRYLWLGLLLTALGWTSQRIAQYRNNAPIKADGIESSINRQSRELDLVLEQLVDISDSDDINDLILKEGFSVFLFHDDSLIFWSDNTIVVPEQFGPNQIDTGFVKWPNVFGICRVIKEHQRTAIGILKLQYRFPFENQFLSNEFLPANSGRRGIQISTDGQGAAIHDQQGSYLFSLKRKENTDRDLFWYLSLIGYLAGLLFLLYFFVDLLKYANQLWKSNWWLLFLVADLFVFRWLLHYIGIPEIFFEWEIFRTIRTQVFLMESLGEMVVSVMAILFLTLAFRKHFKLYPSNFDSSTRENNPRLVDGFTTAGWLLVMASAWFLFKFWTWVNAHAQGVIELNNLISLKQTEFFLILLMIMTGLAFILVLFTLASQTLQLYSWKRLIPIPVVSAVIVFGLTSYAGSGLDWVSLVTLMLIILASIVVFAGKKDSFNPIGILLLLGLSAAYFVFFLDFSNHQREKAMQRELIVNLTNEHDPIAEMILQRMDQDILNDSLLIQMIQDPSVMEDDIENYLINNRFGSYWNRYSINVNVCDSVNLMVIAPENIEVTCFNYWENIRLKDGQQLGQSHFYYLDNFDGKIWYLGKFPVYNLDSTYVYHMWISAESLLSNEGLGYPDLLISGENSRDTLSGNYSYAKYQNCQLISRTGDYNYASSCELYPISSDEIIYFEEEGYGHWLSRLDQNSMVIMSKPLTTFFEHLISFSYLFVFFYLIWILISSAMYLPGRIKDRGWDMKSKIQITMVSILIFSFILIGIGLTYFILNQYDDSSKNAIYEKTQSVLIEIQHKLDMEDELTADWSSPDYPNLQALLVKFSFVFNSDIHIYDPRGWLIASSRPEVFQRNLTGGLMDPIAFNQLSKMKKMEFIHRERIGSLGYWSAYVPFYNYRGELQAYLNLPYFSKQSEIRRDVTNFLVAMLNGYFLLIFLAIVLAVILGNQVTKPLQMLKERFTGVHLGAKNTEIIYKRNDEIGGLVQAYNQMLKELEASAEMLARSERETAWREMAKQIAHEIKNPLTPMKLSVQHLKRSWDDRVENWDQYLDRVTKTLVEQIDSLSAIANEFSQFAKMPRARREETDLIERIKSTLALFTEAESAQIQFHQDSSEPLLVFADREQLAQVFNNLITNAIQSVPTGRIPKINIQAERKGSHVVIAITDNGVGIPKELKDKLFQPNFTTKSSGMGLGLAITRNIVENSDGNIWFESGEKGTTFYVEFPLI